MLDKSIPYKNIVMRMTAGDVARMKPPELHEGFHYRFFREGDETHWARIEASVLEFDSENLAREYFVREYVPHIDELKRRCVFIANPEGVPIATATAWFIDGAYGCRNSLNWVAVCPEYQGRGLGRAAVLEAMSVFHALRPSEDVMLHTQTWSHVAVRLYRSIGFRMARLQRIPDGGGVPPNEFEEAIEVLRGVMDPEVVADLIASAM